MSPQDDQALLLELAQACERLAVAVELPARVPGDRKPAPLTWTFFDELPDEALLSRLLTALGAWDPDDPERSSVSPEAELELVEFAAHARNLIEKSSLSEPSVRLRADPERIDKIRRMLQQHRSSKGAQ